VKKHFNDCSLLLLLLLLLLALPLMAQEEQTIVWPEYWFFLAGDNLDWARPDFNDSGWIKLPFGTFPSGQGRGTGWYRIHLEVDPGEWNKAKGILIECAGALEIYQNGDLVHRIGRVGSSAEESDSRIVFKPELQRISFQEPPSSLSNPKEQVIAIRYSRYFKEASLQNELDEFFTISLTDYEGASKEYKKQLTRATLHQTLLVGLSLTFALFHFLLFVFYPKSRSNLFFALLAFCVALIVFSDFQIKIVTSPALMLFFQRVNFIFIPLTGLAALRFIYSLFYSKRPRQYSWFFFVGIVLSLLAWFKPYFTEPFLRIFLFLILLEFVRTILYIRLRKAQALIPGGWIIALGCIPLLLTVAIENLSKIVDVAFVWEYWNLSSAYSFLVLMFSMSLFLARDFGRTKKNLEKRKDELSQLNLELEDRVSQRTAELAEANASLEEQYIKLQESRDYIQKAHKELKEAHADLRQAQARLVQSEKMASLGNLVAGIAHEINNPIGAIKSAADSSQRSLQLLAQLLKKSSDLDELKNDPQFQKVLDILQSNSNLNTDASVRITEIVKSLKSFSRLDQAEFQEADLHEGLDSTITLMQHEMKDRIEILRDYGELPLVCCNPNQINQVFMNVLDNAFHAVKEKGTVAIKTIREGDFVTIRFVDDGVGISEVEIGKIFDPGYTTKGRGVGTGLGLSISYNIITDHKGTIAVKSDIGQGTELTISLPIKPE